VYNPLKGTSSDVLQVGQKGGNTASGGTTLVVQAPAVVNALAFLAMPMHLHLDSRSLDSTSRYDDPDAPTTFIAYTPETIKKLSSRLRAIPSHYLHDQDAVNSPNGQHGAEEQWTRI
jgi:hypothetical protein